MRRIGIKGPLKASEIDREVLISDGEVLPCNGGATKMH